MNRDEQKDTPILLISAAAPHLLLHLPITFGLEGGSHTQRSGTEDCVISFSFFHFLECSIEDIPTKVRQKKNRMSRHSNWREKKERKGKKKAFYLFLTRYGWVWEWK